MQKGVLGVEYYTGEHGDYHGRGDSPDKIDYEKLEKITRTIFASAWTIANRPSRPVIDKPLPEAQRTRQLFSY